MVINRMDIFLCLIRNLVLSIERGSISVVDLCRFGEDKCEIDVLFEGSLNEYTDIRSQKIF